MGKEVHHGIENDRRCGVLVAHVFRQFQDAVRLASQSANGGGIVQGIACDGEPIDAPEAHVPVVFIRVAAYDALPCQCVQPVDNNPDAQNGYEPVACFGKVCPQFGKANVERQNHHYHGSDAKDEE